MSNLNFFRTLRIDRVKMLADALAKARLFILPNVENENLDDADEAQPLVAEMRVDLPRELAALMVHLFIYLLNLFTLQMNNILLCIGPFAFFLLCFFRLRDCSCIITLIGEPTTNSTIAKIWSLHCIVATHTQRRR